MTHLIWKNMKSYTAILETDAGDIHIDLFPDTAPNAVSVDDRMPVNDLSVLQVMVIESLTGFT